MNNFIYSSINSFSSTSTSSSLPQPSILYSTSLDGHNDPVTYPFEYVQRIELIPERTSTKGNNGNVRHSTRLRGKRDDPSSKTLSAQETDGSEIFEDNLFDGVHGFRGGQHEGSIDTLSTNKPSLDINPRILARQRALQDFKRDFSTGGLEKVRELCNVGGGKGGRETPISPSEISPKLSSTSTMDTQTYSLPSPKAYIPSKPTTVPYTTYSTVHPGTIIKPVVNNTKIRMNSQIAKNFPKEKPIVTKKTETYLPVPLDPFDMNDEISMEPLPITSILPTEFANGNASFGGYPVPVLPQRSQKIGSSSNSEKKSHTWFDPLKKSNLKNSNKISKDHDTGSSTGEMDEEMDTFNPTTTTYVTEGSNFDETKMINVDTCTDTTVLQGQSKVTNTSSSTNNMFPIIPALRLTYHIYAETSANIALAVSNPMSPGGMQVLRNYNGTQ